MHVTTVSEQGAISPETPSRPGVPAGAVDFDLHGVVGVRLLGASESDLRAVQEQLGLPPGALSREPDVTIRFSERLHLPRLRLLGLDDAGFTDDAFVLLRGRHKSRVRVQVPMAEVGGRCEIACESGLPAVPLLIAIVNLTALGKGVLPLHACAFVHRGTGVVVTGWAKGGKTETLLGFMARGATYVGDEWVYLSADGRRVHGIPEPLTVWDWHLDDVPEYRTRLTPAERARQRAVRAAHAADRRAKGAPARLLRRALPVLEGQAAVQVEPGRLFGPGRYAPEAPFDALVLTMSHEDAATTVEEIDPGEVARRMVSSLQYERLDLLAAYHKYQFAFPGSKNPNIEQAGERQKELLERALAGKPAWVVAHPYPVPVDAVVRAMEPLLP
jgi:hypothetical protein